MSKDQLNDRLKRMFSDVERLATNPLAEAQEFRAALEDLRARLSALEAEAAASPANALETEPAPAPARSEVVIEKDETPHRPVIHVEREWIGYAFTGGEVKPVEKKKHTEAEIAAPLVASGQPIGAVQVQKPPERAWTREEQELLEAVARQASLQIQDLQLLSAAEQARAEAEQATRRFIHESWESYLDAIQQREQVGYAYDQSGIAPLDRPPALEGGIQEAIKVMEERVGMLYLQPDPTRPLSQEDQAIIASVANRVAQQVENIRLLAEASRARAEAEKATRRLTREGWQAYTSQAGAALGFVYDSNQVKPLKEIDPSSASTFDLPLTVRGETIGSLSVAQKELTPEAAELANAIAERVSAHLETLRLAEELQKRAAELQTVARVSTTASTVLNPDELLQSVVDMTRERFGLYHADIYLANEQWQTLLISAGSDEVGRKMVERQDTIPMNAEVSIVARAARERRVVIVNDVQRDPSYLFEPLLPNTRAEMSIPMLAGDKLLGVFDILSDALNRFTEEDANIFTTLTAQVSVALQNARLYAEQTATVAQLRELDRLKSSFLANMSHELRTPLNSILGFADVILEELDGPLTENMTTDLKLIQKNGQHLLHLINDVLDMAKIESGRMNLNPEKFRLLDLIEEVTSITSPLASEKNLALFVTEDSDMQMEIMADRTRMRQVLINLVNNAIKFTETGKISIQAQRVNHEAHIRVQDTGIGIPPDKLEAIFQEFTQVDSSTTRKAGGTGLGLPISRRLVEMHGGRLWAESTGVEGKGAAFFIVLPLEGAEGN